MRKDFYFLGASAIFFIISIVLNPGFLSYFTSAFFIILVILAILVNFILSFNYNKIADLITLVVSLIVFLITVIYLSFSHPNVFNFLGWTCLGLEILYITIKHI